MGMAIKCAHNGFNSHFNSISVYSARDIQILKHLQDVSATEKESVTFVCEVNLEEVDGKWFKNKSRIKAGENVRIRQEGKR